MLFNSFEFIFIFLPTVLITFFAIGSQQHHRIAITWLVSASLFFYGWWNPPYVGFLIFSLLFNYSMGLVLCSKNKNKVVLFVGVAVNLGLLSYFKYTNFLVDNLNYLINENYNVSYIILPLAISFFTFQQIAYLVDAYRNETREYNFLHYTLFVTFFPQLIAGPIVHHREMLPQFSMEKTYRLYLPNIKIGLTIFVIGLFKKVILADGIAEFSTPVFNAADAGQTLSFFEAWGGAFAYSMQLYFDFSGYADMAIGISRMFGIVLPLNFNSPYKSQNIISFWRTWHMTLSRFLKDYLYIAIGGSRKGSRYVNLFITMLLGGLWHGAAWNFIIWGALHGVYLIINHGWRKFRQVVLGQDMANNSFIGVALSTFITFLVVTIAWVFFRAVSLEGSINMLQAMAGVNGFVFPARFESFIPGVFSNLLEFQAGSGIHSFPSMWGFVWIFLLLIVVFYFPNTNELGLKLEAEVKDKKSICPSFLSVLLPITVAVAFFISVKVILSVPDSEFLYFNF